MTVYGIKNCDSVKKARKFLDERGIAYDFVDFKTTPVDCTTVRHWLEQTDLSKLFNKRGTTYRKLGLKALELDDEQSIEWLCKENLLIKRPVIEYNGMIIVGFDPTLYEGAFNQ